MLFGYREERKSSCTFNVHLTVPIIITGSDQNVKSKKYSTVEKSVSECNNKNSRQLFIIYFLN